MPRFLLVHVPSKQFEKNLLELFFFDQSSRPGVVINNDRTTRTNYLVKYKDIFLDTVQFLNFLKAEYAPRNGQPQWNPKRFTYQTEPDKKDVCASK